ncbi:MFS transporter [Pseudomonas sp. S9]|uniref:MFS transporter n=1 Tax=Pseudomonas sp. S9 TaxID=686578 RepID=UPI000255696A|nr:MFS transporter [Pseudomonas sp. S9]
MQGIAVLFLGSSSASRPDLENSHAGSIASQQNVLKRRVGSIENHQNALLYLPLPHGTQPINMQPFWYRSLNKDARRSFWTVFCGFSVDSLDVQLYAFILPVLLAAWGLSHSEAGLLGAATLTSSALGGWVAGMMADRFGRLRVLKLTILWFAISTCLCGLAADFDQLLIARTLQGIGFGGELAVGAVFIAEIAGPNVRSRMVGMAQSGWAVGWGLAAIISAISLTLLPPELGWRVTFILGVLPAIAIFIYRLKLKEPQAFMRSSRQFSWRAILSGPYLKSTILGSLLAAGMHSGYWAIAIWWPAMLEAEHGLATIESRLYLAVLVTGSFLGYVAGSWLGDIAGRKATLLMFALGGICIALTYSNLSLYPTAMLLLSFPLGFVATGMFGVIGSVLTELFPTELRASGLGFCYNFGRGIAGLAPAVIGVTSETMGITGAIATYVVCAYILVMIVALLLPETRGVRLKNLSET